MSGESPAFLLSDSEQRLLSSEGCSITVRRRGSLVLSLVRVAVQWLTGMAPPREFERSDAPAWIVKMTVSHLPNGGSESITLALARDKCTLEIRKGVWFLRRWAATARLELGLEETAQITKLLEQAASEPGIRSTGFVFDGSPFSLKAYRREPFRLLRLSGNLMGGFRSVGDANTTMSLVALAQSLGYRN
jgi:hypothetical protein